MDRIEEIKARHKRIGIGKFEVGKDMAYIFDSKGKPWSTDFIKSSFNDIDDLLALFAADQARIAQLETDVEQVGRERDAAMADIMRSCHTCAKSHYECGDFEEKAFGKKKGLCGWQWRGVQEG